MTNLTRRVHDATFKTKRGSPSGGPGSPQKEPKRWPNSAATGTPDRFDIHARQITERSGVPVERQVIDGISNVSESPTSKPVLNIEQREQIKNPLFQQKRTLKQSIHDAPGSHRYPTVCLIFWQ